MQVLGIDPGGITGWAIGSTLPNRREIAGWWDITPQRGESPGVRYYRLRRHLHEVLDAMRVDLVVYEQSHQRGGAATEYAGGYAAVIQEVCYEREVELAKVHSGTLKKHATGKGNSPKPRVQAAAVSRWPHLDYLIHDHDDVADALWLMDYGRVHVIGTRAAGSGGESSAAAAPGRQA